MAETYIRLRCNQEPDRIEIEPEQLLDGFCEALDCDCIETVHLVGGYLMIIDESGKLKDKPLNPIASILYSRQSSDWIAGDALLARIGSRNGETDIVPLGTHETLLTLSQATTIWERIQRRNGEEI